jgi:hypothetical protein
VAGRGAVVVGHDYVHRVVRLQADVQVPPGLHIQRDRHYVAVAAVDGGIEVADGYRLGTEYGDLLGEQGHAGEMPI